MPKVSVIICTIQRLHALRSAIEAVFTSTLQDTETIVVEGLSGDGTHSMLLTLYDKKLITYCNNDDGNRIDARNTGWKVAKGEYVCFLDDDDTMSKNRLEAQARYLDEHPDIDIVSCTTIFDKTSGIVHTLSELNHPQIIDLLKEKEIDNVINFQSCMFRKSAIDKWLNGRLPFRQEFIGGAEGNVFLYELLINGGFRIANISNALYVYQVGIAKNSLSARFEPTLYLETLWDNSWKDREFFIQNIEANMEKIRAQYNLKKADEISQKPLDKPVIKVTKVKSSKKPTIAPTEKPVEVKRKTKDEMIQDIFSTPIHFPTKEYLDKEIKKARKRKEQQISTEVPTEIPTEKPKRIRKKKEETTEAPTEAPKKRGRKKKNTEESK